MISTYTAKPKVTNGQSFGEGAYDMSKVIVNNTGLTIVIVHSNGTHVVIEPSSHIRNFKDGLTVLEKINTKAKSKLNSLGYLNESNEEFENGPFHQSYNVAYHIPTDEISRRRDGVYVQNLDILVVEYTGGRVPKHPRHSESMHHYVDTRLESTLSVDIIIIDNFNILGNPYICIGGEPIKVTPTKRVHLTDGVYIIRRYLDRGFSEVECKRYGFRDEKNPVKFYNSYDEAISKGDVVEQMKRSHDIEVQRLKNEGVSATAELNRLKSEIERDKLERDMKSKEEEALRELTLRQAKEEAERRANELEAARKELDHERKLRELGTKDYYDARQAERKDTSELMKFIPTVISFVVMMVTMVNNGKGK